VVRHSSALYGRCEGCYSLGPLPDALQPQWPCRPLDRLSSRGFGFVVCQPGKDDSSEAAMVAYQSGSDYAFMTNEAKGVLCPVAFVGHCSRENEVRLHSHLGEGFVGD